MKEKNDEGRGRAYNIEGHNKHRSPPSNKRLTTKVSNQQQQQQTTTTMTVR